MHLPERTYCSSYFSHLPLKGKKISLVIQDGNKILNVLMTGMVCLILRANAFLKPLAGYLKVYAQKLGYRRRELGNCFF